MKRVIGICLVTLGATSGLSWLFFYEQYSWIRPTSPQPAYAQVVEVNNHGHIFFISKSDDDFLCLLFFGAMTLSIVGGLLLEER